MDNKLINSRCICKKGLPWVKIEVVMLEPCEHLIHTKCFKELNTKNCPFCNTEVTRIIGKDDYKYDPKLYQKCTDILSMSCAYVRPSFDIGNFILGIPNIIGVLCQLPFSKGEKNALKICSDLLSGHNVKIKIKGLSKLKNEPKVFISNHSSHFDYLILFYVLKTGFLSSTFINDNIISKQINNIIPMMVIDRKNKNSNTVEKMKEHVAENGSICVFPEGIITNPNALIRFRTGAFHTGYPVYPIVLKYHANVGNSSVSKFIFRMIAKQNVRVTMYILDPVYPPFNDKKIEQVRYNMAKRGKLLLSRVSNRDIIG